SFFLLAEELGLPFHIPGMNIFSGIVENAARHIYQYSPEWAIFQYLEHLTRIRPRVYSIEIEFRLLSEKRLKIYLMDTTK
ncbi:hypothetical protein, partial [Cronobacter sakazakii]